MMIERLQRLLSGIRELSGWRINQRQIEGRELFFIRRDVDMQRSKDVDHISLTVYRDFEEGGTSYRGSVVVQIHPTHSDEQLRASIEQSLNSARYVRNESYPLAEPGSRIVRMPESGFAARPLEQWLPLMAEAVYAQEEGQEARINSSEFFLNRIHARIVNSSGLDVSYLSHSAYVELIVESSGSAGEVELYRELSFSDFDADALGAEVSAQLRHCRDRASARPTPHLKRAAVVITGEPVADFFNYYLLRSAARSVYSGVSTAKVGESIQGERISGESLNLTLEPLLENSPQSAPVDADGFALASTPVVRDSRLERYWGPLRFCHYLGVPATGSIGNVSVQPGSRADEELRREPHLEVVYFSDFVTEPLTGDFGGEIRLGYYQDADGNRTPVTGGSVSGNVLDVQQRMYFSRQIQNCAGFRGPQSILLPEVNVAGAAST